MIKRCGPIGLLLLVSACGGEAPTEETGAVASPPVPPATQSTNNPFAGQQQALKQAGMVQGILDQEEEKKKKALAESN